VRAVLLVSYLIAIVACLYGLRAVWRRDQDSWQVGTGAGLVLLNAFAAGLAAAVNVLWAIVIVVVQLVGSALLLRRPARNP